MKFLKLTKLNFSGIAHYILPILVVVGVGAVGTVVFEATHAASIPCTKQTFVQGTSGHCVKDIQEILDESIPKQVSITVSSKFNSATTSGVKVFQKDSGLAANGIVQGKTWSKLCSAYLVGGNQYVPDPKKDAGC